MNIVRHFHYYLNYQKISLEQLYYLSYETVPAFPNETENHGKLYYIRIFRPSFLSYQKAESAGI